ncbi:MAG: hypothetical protein AWU57_1623 [Marinobacter sp. T13-3]|nr:MAG: hypothetical protein AWU57_1623 [Marinobacter sp. T13-3]
MTSILIPPSHLKAYTRLLRKANPSVSLKRGHVLNTLCHLSGLKDYSNYERHINKRDNPALTAFDAAPPVPASHLPLPQLEAHANVLGADIVSALSENTGAPIALPPALVVGDRHLPSTPLDHAIQYQVDNLGKLPALRMSGVLYLMSFLSGQAIFDGTQQTVDWTALADLVKADAVPAAIHYRLASYEALNAYYGSHYHEGLFQAARVALKDGTIDEGAFVERIQGVLEQEWSYLSRARLGPPAKTPPPFTFPLYEGDSGSSDYLGLITTMRRLTTADRPVLLGMQAPSERTTTSTGLCRETPVRKWFARRKALTITADTLRDNVMILGMAGSGRSVATQALVTQALMHSTGAVIVDAKGTPQDHWHLQSMASFHGRADDLTLLTVHHEQELGAIDLARCVQQNTVAHLMLPAMEKAPEQLRSHILSILDRLRRTAYGAGPALAKRPFPYLVVLQDVLSAIQTDADLAGLQAFIDRMNRNHVAVILSDQDLVMRRAHFGPAVARLFGGCLVMRHGEPDYLPYSLGTAACEAIRRQQEGEFHYVTADGGMDPITYRSPYAVPETAHQLYLVMG